MHGKPCRNLLPCGNFNSRVFRLYIIQLCDYAVCCIDPADLGVREPVWTIRSRHERATGTAVIEMAAGDMSVGPTPFSKNFVF